jgi:hypothetical protein
VALGTIIAAIMTPQVSLFAVIYQGEVDPVHQN